MAVDDSVQLAIVACLAPNLEPKAEQERSCEEGNMRGAGIPIPVKADELDGVNAVAAVSEGSPGDERKKPPKCLKKL